MPKTGHADLLQYTFRTHTTKQSALPNRTSPEQQAGTHRECGAYTSYKTDDTSEAYEAPRRFMGQTSTCTK